MVHKYQMIHNKVTPKVHLHGVSSCALHQYDLNGSATNMLHYHYQLCIFWHQYYEYVYHYDRDPTNHFIGCMTIEGFIHVNRTTIILYLNE